MIFKYLYSALNNRGPTEALLVRLAPRKETSFKKRWGSRKIGW